MLEARGVWFRYKRDRILRDISISLSVGETITIIGSNGSGKTTLAMILAGILKPSRGYVLADGEDPRGRVYLAFQDARLLDISVREFLSLLSDDLDMLPFLGIERVIDSRGKNLSAGRRKRVHLQAAYASRHRYVILDEPEAGIDSIEIAERAIEAIAKRKGLIIITHEPRLMRGKTLRLSRGMLYEEDR